MIPTYEFFLSPPTDNFKVVPKLTPQVVRGNSQILITATYTTTDPVYMGIILKWCQS